MSLRLNGSTSGYSEIVAPAVAGDQTFTLPTTSGNVLTDVSDLEAQVKTATNATGSAPIYSCRAWVNFNGTGTVAIRDSGNVSSITDNGTGDYTVNFTTALEDANYSVTTVNNQDNGQSAARCFAIHATSDSAAPSTMTASAVRLFVRAVSNVDSSTCCVTIFR